MRFYFRNPAERDRMSGVKPVSTISPPKVHKTATAVDFSKTAAWLEQHRLEYIGKWVVLDGDRLIGSGVDPAPIVAEARSQGVHLPFVEFIGDERSNNDTIRM
ncbi:MAG: hypothetical protein ACREDR_05805 [Blastocatellia bacterium]